MTSPDELMTSDEVAAWLRTPVSTLAYWRKKGGGPPFIKLLRRAVYRRSAVASWLADRERQSQAAS